MKEPRLSAARAVHKGIRRGLGKALCQLEDLSDPGSASFVVKRGEERINLMVVRRGAEVFGYLNSCPHIGAPLDWEVEGFLDAEGHHILCAYHGATFRMEDGFCVGGPPEGNCLTPLALTLEDGSVRPDGW